CLRHRVVAFFKELEIDLKHARQQEIYRAQVSHRQEPREPIRSVGSRLKHPISLFRKLVIKQEDFERQPTSRHLYVHEVEFALKNFGALTEPQAILRGPGRYFLKEPPHGGAQVRVQSRLGVKGGPQAVALPPRDGFSDATLKDIPRGVP